MFPCSANLKIKHRHFSLLFAFSPRADAASLPHGPNVIITLFAFPGMVIEPKKSYKQVVKSPYKITQAVLSGAEESKGTTDLILTIGNNKIIACTLSKAHPHVALNLKLNTGDSICLNTRGGDTDKAVHLSGYILEDATAPAAGKSNNTAAKKETSQKHKDLQKLLDKTMSDSDDDDLEYLMNGSDFSDGDLDEEQDDEEEMGDDDDDDDQMGDDEELSGDEEEDDDDDDMSEDTDADEEEEEEEVQPPPSKKKKDNAQQALPTKKKGENAQQQQQQKKEKEPKQAAQTNGAAASKGKVVSLAGGVKVKDTKEGTGAFAKPGKNVVVYYEGRVQGKNQIFDSCKQGSGFKFMLGRGTVIKGWDLGVSIWPSKQLKRIRNANSLSLVF